MLSDLAMWYKNYLEYRHKCMMYIMHHFPDCVLSYSFRTELNKQKKGKKKKKKEGESELATC